MKTAKGLKIDYISICDPETLDNKQVIKGKTLIATAVYIGKTRLIDNIVVN
jgi:pantoate--beta-alanine ligase